MTMTDKELIARLREGATWDDDIVAADRIEALVGEAAKMTDALRRIREAWPTVRDAEGSGGTISAAIDEIDAALAEIEGEK